MAKSEPKILCKTPTPGKQGTRIAKWKYDSVRAAIRKAVAQGADGVELRDLSALVKKHLYRYKACIRCRNDILYHTRTHRPVMSFGQPASGPNNGTRLRS